MKMIEQKDDKHSGVHLSKLFTRNTNHGDGIHLKNCFVIVTIYHWHVAFSEKQICQMGVTMDSICQLLPLNIITEGSCVCAAHSLVLLHKYPTCHHPNFAEDKLWETAAVHLRPGSAGRALLCLCGSVQPPVKTHQPFFTLLGSKIWEHMHSFGVHDGTLCHVPIISHASHS